MKKLSIIFLTLCIFTACNKESDELTTSTASSNTDTGEQLSKASPVKPFYATLNATANTDPSIPSTMCSGDLPGFSAPDFFLNGNATHMGQLNFGSNLHHSSCNLSFTTMLLTTQVTVDLVAANGDLIHCSGNDIVNVASLLTQTGSTGAITGTWTINGGTGKFLNASGSFTISGIVNFVSNSFTCNCTGTISY